MIYLGQNPVGLLTHDSNEWKVKQIIASSSIIQRADLIKIWAEEICPESSLAILLRDNYNTNTSGEGTLLQILLINNNAKYYVRRYQDQLQFRSDWTSNYYLTVNENDTYTIFYK